MTSKGHRSQALVHLTHLLKDTATAAVPHPPPTHLITSSISPLHMVFWLHWVFVAVHQLSQVSASGATL